MKRLKLIIMLTFSCSVISCTNKTSKSTKQVETIVGSTWDNINNSVHSVIEFNIEGEVCFATINQYFQDYKEKNKFPYSLWVTVETLEKNDNGHPIGSEAELFNSLEDSLIGSFIENTPFCYIGRTTRNGYRELMFYVTDKDKASAVMSEFIKKDIFKRKVEFAIDPDKEWESVSGLYN